MATTMTQTKPATTSTHAFEQSKLTRREWEGLEVPLPPAEVAVLKMITSGWHDTTVCTNPRNSLLTVTKLGSLAAPHDFIFTRFLLENVYELKSKYEFIRIPEQFKENTKNTNKSSKKQNKKNEAAKLSSADSIRLANIDYESLKKNTQIWEYAILSYIRKLCESLSGAKRERVVAYYTLSRALEAVVENTNPYIVELARGVLKYCAECISLDAMVEHIESASELNPELQTFANRVLYKHQKDLVDALKIQGPKLILYQAPTGTGKTLSPLAVGEGYKTIFVCASKHVGMQLARACISIQKRIAVAFGCQDPGDIRLHYYAVSECIRKKRSGGIGKVDHSQGQKADIIISDATSYLSAMRYMLSWNDKDKMLVYWDEPTIAMDKASDPLHDIVRRSWSENVIPNIVLSSATLPPASDLPSFIEKTQAKFHIRTENIVNISNYECARTVPIVAKSGYVAMPHTTAKTKEELARMVEQCQTRSTLLRHIDLGCAARFVLQGIKQKGANPITDYFTTIDEVSPELVKRAYLNMVYELCSLPITLDDIASLSKENKRYSGGVDIATRDAVTITHGPALYLATDTEKVAKYIIKNANPSSAIIDTLQERVFSNSAVIQQIQQLEKDLDDRRGKHEDNVDDEKESAHAGAITSKLEKMRARLSDLKLPDVEVPNTDSHQRRFHDQVSADAFTGKVPPHHLMEVLQLDVANWKKMLLMMGIGVFGEECVPYKELMSRMASERELFCVIAGTDYVYGTNYQFCHGYIGKDLKDIPIEKMYQALGRVGRGRQAGQYSWRLRDDALARKIFLPDDKLSEARRMDRLMSGR
jgi:hypothetical protein